jgi:hypothetical protein
MLAIFCYSYIARYSKYTRQLGSKCFKPVGAPRRNGYLCSHCVKHFGEANAKT